MGETEPINLYDSLENWASKENRELHSEVLELQRLLDSDKNTQQELQERVSILKNHLQNVQTEVSKTQELLTAKESLVKEEVHLKQLISREMGKTQSEISKTEEKTKEIKDHWTKVQAKIFTAQQRIQAFKEEANMNQQELEQWITIARQKEEDFLVLQRYQREDEGRIRSMLLEIEKSTGIIESKKTELETEVTATRALQIELDMTAEQFRQMHDERTQLLGQWEQTMKQMEELNARIDGSTKKYDQRREELEKLHILIIDQKKKLDAAIGANDSVERQLTIGDHKVSKLHKQMESDQMELVEFKETVVTQQHQLEKLESDEKAYLAEISELEKMIDQEIQKKEYYLNRLKETEDALVSQKDLTKDIGEQTNILNEFMRKEEAEQKKLEKEIDAGKQSIFKLSQEVSQVKKQQKDLRSAMEGSQTRAKNLQMKIQDLDRETQKQMELLYNSNFQIQQMERKIARIEGERTEEEKIELQTQIDSLEIQLNNKQNESKNLDLQLHRLELDLRQAVRKKEKTQVFHEQLEVKLNEIRLDQQSLNKSTSRALSSKETVLVQLNILRLQVEKLSEQVNMKSDELISLENRRQQLQLSMEERIYEIDAHLAALKTQLKTEEEAKHLANIEYKERVKRAETLEAKYQILMGKYQVEGEEVNQSYHINKFAKEREEVSRRGDELNEAVKVAAKELNQLEKAMNKLNGHNFEFRRAFTSVTENDNDMERKKVLEEQVRVAQQRLNARKAEANRQAEENRKRESIYKDQETVIDDLQKEITNLRPAVEKTAEENDEIKDKITRLQKILQKSREKHRTENKISHGTKYPATLLEMDIEIRMEKYNVELAFNELNRIAETSSEIIPTLKIALTQMGIPLKAIPTLQRPTQDEHKGHPTIKPKGPRIISPYSSTNRIGSSDSRSRNSSNKPTPPSSFRSGNSSNRSSASSSGRSDGSQGSRQSIPTVNITPNFE